MAPSRKSTRVRKPPKKASSANNLSSRSVDVPISCDATCQSIPVSPDSQSMANLFLRLSDFQETVLKRIDDLERKQNESEFQPVNHQKVPTLESKSFSKQHEFNQSVYNILSEARQKIQSDPEAATKILDSGLSQLESRNCQLVLADRYPGALSLIESLEELDDLKSDPKIAPLIGDPFRLAMLQNGPHFNQVSGRSFQYYGGRVGGPYSSDQFGQVQL